MFAMYLGLKRHGPGGPSENYFSDLMAKSAVCVFLGQSPLRKKPAAKYENEVLLNINQSVCDPVGKYFGI